MGKYLTPEIVHAVIAEYGPEGMRAAGYSAADMLSLMNNAGYQCIDLSSNKAIKTYSDIPNLPDFSVTDFLFTPLKEINFKELC